MKVLHITNTIAAGGAELHLLTLCRQLKRRGIETVVACLREQVEGSRRLRSDFEQEAIRIENLRAGNPYLLWSLGRLAALLKRERPDILHTHLPRADFVGAIGNLFCPSIPWICSVHGIYSDVTWSGKWTLPLLDLALGRAKGVIAISSAVKEWLVRRMGVRPEKIKVVHYGIEPERFSRPVRDLRAEWGLDRLPVIGSIGRLEPGKGHDVLIRAMQAVHRRVPCASLLIAGHDPWNHGDTLRAVVGEQEMNGHVKLVGFQDDVVSFLHTLDVFAFASISEGFGQVVIEAMAAGKPVVANRIPPFTEIVAHAETGLLVEPRDPHALADAVTWLLLHPDEARRMGACGQSRVYERFSAERMAGGTLDFYRSCVSER